MNMPSGVAAVEMVEACMHAHYALDFFAKTALSSQKSWLTALFAHLVIFTKAQKSGAQVHTCVIIF